jgi:hypothetical protein
MDDKRKSFEEAAKPLIKWLNENANPHTKAIVETDGAELVSGEMNIICTEFIED